MPHDDLALKVSGLSVTRGDDLPILESVDLTIRRGRVVALVGESGSGKSCLVHAINGLLPRGLRTATGTVLLASKSLPAGIGAANSGGQVVDLLALSEKQMSRIRGRCIGFVPQSAMSGLDPLMTIRDSLREAVQVHRNLPIAEVDAMADAAMLHAGLSEPFVRAADCRPGALSGGQRQRVLIAQALINNPELVLYDEPTSALDAERRNAIYRAIRRHVDQGGAAIVVTHDLLSAASVADEVVVLYLGRVVERGPSGLVLDRPLHPYTRALIDCAPLLDRRAPLQPIVGELPMDRSCCNGCRFHPRCDLREWRCAADEPRLRLVRTDREVACHVR